MLEPGTSIQWRERHQAPLPAHQIHLLAAPPLPQVLHGEPGHAHGGALAQERVVRPRRPVASVAQADVALPAPPLPALSPGIRSVIGMLSGQVMTVPSIWEVEADAYGGDERNSEGWAILHVHRRAIPGQVGNCSSRNDCTMKKPLVGFAFQEQVTWRAAAA